MPGPVRYLLYSSALFLSFYVIFVDMLDLDPEYRSLHLIEPAVKPDLVMIVADPAAVVPEAHHVFRQTGVIGYDHAAVAVAAEVLAGEKTEAADIAERAGFPAFVFGAE